MALQRAAKDKVHTMPAGGCAVYTTRLNTQEARNVEQHAAERHCNDRRDGERFADDLPSL